MLVTLLSTRAAWRHDLRWKPRWWQFATICALVLVPIFGWGRFIAARATVPTDALYGFLPKSGFKDVLNGAVLELTLLHSPWRETNGIKAHPTSYAGRLFHSVSEGVPLWIGAIVFGGIVVALYLTRRAPISAVSHIGEQSTRDTAGFQSESAPLSLRLVAIGTLATVVLYPPALRIMNWLNVGFDFTVVERYSAAFTPLLAILALLLVRRRWFERPLAVIGVVAALGTVSGAI